MIANREFTATGKKARMLNTGGLQLRSHSDEPRGPSGGRGQTEAHQNSTSGVEKKHQRVGKYEAGVTDSWFYTPPLTFAVLVSPPSLCTYSVISKCMYNSTLFLLDLLSMPAGV